MADSAKPTQDTRKRKGEQQPGWWTSECYEARGSLRKSLREIREGREEGTERRRQQYLIKRRRYREVCAESKGKWKTKVEDKIKTEADFWKFVNKGRRKINNGGERITEERWIKHFADQLGGEEAIEADWMEGRSEEISREDRWEREITEEEVGRAINEIAVRKAAGSDEIESEVWKYAPPEVKRGLTDLFNKVWDSGSIPREWSEAIVVPIYKNGDKTDPGNYRGISLLSTAYKIFESVLNKRLMAWAEEMGQLPENQMGFRKGRGTRDGVYVLHTLVEQQLAKKRGKLYAYYIDLKVAFDSVNREKLGREVWDKGVRGKMYRVLDAIYKSTENRVRTAEGLTNVFRLSKGVRQGCPLSPLLFNIFIADLEQYLKGKQEGGVVINGIKIWLLAYADDMVLMAVDPKQMQEMLNALSRYLRWKGLELNYGKSKMQIFKKSGKRARAENWSWEGEVVEVVKVFKYLGVMMQCNNGFEEHIRYIKKKARIGLGKVWGIGERNWKGDVNVKWKLFRALIESIMTYGAEIWGWAEQKELQLLITKYWRWVLGVRWNVPGYIIQEEVDEKQLWAQTWKRAYKYEKRLLIEEWTTWMHRCAQWRKEVAQKGIRWRVERRKVLEKLGISEEGVRELEGRGWEVTEDIERRIEERKFSQNWQKMQSSRYNPMYKDLKPEQRRARYLQSREVSDKDKVLFAKYRTGSEVGAANYWQEKETRMCKTFGELEETLEHVVERCGRVKGREKGKTVLEILGEDGKGRMQLRELDRERKTRQRD